MGWQRMTSSLGSRPGKCSRFRLLPGAAFCVHPFACAFPALLLILLALAWPCRAASRWSTAAIDVRTAALAGAGLAMDEGRDPAQWASVEVPRLQVQQDVGPGETLGNAVGYCSPFGPGLQYLLEAAQLKGDDSLAGGKYPRGFRDARMRAGIAQAVNDGDGFEGLSYGLALNYADRGEGPVRRFGVSLDSSVRYPWGNGLSTALALRDLPLPYVHPDDFAGEGCVGLAYRLGQVHLDVDLAWPLPALNRGPVQLRFGAAYSPRPWAQLLAGVSSEESAGRGPQLGCGASLRHDELELSLSAMQRPHGEHTSVRAALAWHFMPPTPPKAVRRVHRAFEPGPEPTPEPETGSFELQAGYREGLLHVAWPAAPQGAAYELLMGLVPGATMKIVTEEPLKVRSWSGNPGMLGMTYYFRVRVLGADGTELGRSRLRSIQVPAGVTP